jgi:ABC-type phosphate/phosphonate transport system permease subunit
MLRSLLPLLLTIALEAWRAAGAAWLQEWPDWLLPCLIAVFAVLAVYRLIRRIRTSIADMSD